MRSATPPVTRFAHAPIAEQVSPWDKATAHVRCTQRIAHDPPVAPERPGQPNIVNCHSCGMHCPEHSIWIHASSVLLRHSEQGTDEQHSRTIARHEVKKPKRKRSMEK